MAFLICAILVGSLIFGGIVLHLARRASSAMETMREHELRYRLCLKAAQMGAWEYDLRTRQMSWPGVVDKTDWFARVHEEDRDRVRESFAAAARGKWYSREEFRFTGEDGETRWLSTAFVREDGPYGVPTRLLGTYHDMTERSRVEEESWQTFKRATSLGEACCTIGHDINNPLMIIQGFAGRLGEEIKKGELTPERGVELVKKIEGAVQRAARVVTGLRSLARPSIEAVKREFSVQALLEETLVRSRERTKTVRVTVDPVAEDVRLAGSPRELSQVLASLLENSVDAVDARDDKWIRISTVKRDGAVEISVTDSGGGIPESLREKMFRETFSTKGEGVGMGLRICKRIVERHRGSISFDGSSQHTRFVIQLPAVKGARHL